MTMARVRMLLFAAATSCFCLLMGSASAHENATVPINHIVGGSFGWQLPENNKTLYEDWTRNRVFGVGDTLSKCFLPSPSIRFDSLFVQNYCMCQYSHDMDVRDLLFCDHDMDVRDLLLCDQLIFC